MFRNTSLFVCAIVCLAALRSTAQDFRVQAAAFADSVPSVYFRDRGVTNVIASVDQNGIYRYFVGSYKTREDAEVIQQQLIAKGFPHASIIDLEEQRALCGVGCPYFTGNRVFTKEAAQETTVRNIYFDFGRYSLSADAKAELERVYEAMKENPNLKLKILGHTDAVGSAQANIQLAASRSRAARNYLIYKGIRADRMFIKVFGESDPAADNSDFDGNDLPDSRKWNRRVVLALMDDKGEVERREQ